MIPFTQARIAWFAFAGCVGDVRERSQRRAVRLPGKKPAEDGQEPLRSQGGAMEEVVNCFERGAGATGAGGAR